MCVSTLGPNPVPNPVPGRLQASQACLCVPLPAPCACWSTWPLRHVPGSPLPLFHRPSSQTVSQGRERRLVTACPFTSRIHLCVWRFILSPLASGILFLVGSERGWVASICLRLSFPTRVCLRSVLYRQSLGGSSQCVSVLY